MQLPTASATLIQILLLYLQEATETPDVYWFVHVDTVDSPYTSKYSVDTIIPKKCFLFELNWDSKRIIGEFALQQSSSRLGRDF